MAKQKKSRRWIIIVLVVLLILVLAALYFKSSSKPKGIEVTTELVTKRTIKETVAASGRIFPEMEVKISSDVSGEIVELYVEEGDSVVVGQVLAKIDPDSYVSAVERGRAGTNSANSQIAIARSSEESSVAQKEQIMAQLINARSVHNRNIKLRDDGVISDVEFEQSLSSLQGLEANLKASEASVRSSQQNIKAAEYQLKSSQATLKELQTSLSRTTIKAPVTGIVSSLAVEQGERVVGTIQMTGTEMMRVANLNSMEVQVEVSENDILKVAVADTAQVEVDAYLGKIFKGTITQIANSAANASSSVGSVSLNTDQVTNFIVKIRLDSESYADLVQKGIKYPFRPGMSASVDIFTEVAENVASVPIQAVTVRQDKDVETEKLDEVVFVYEADTARMVQVTTGIQDNEFIELLTGASDSMNIVIGPYSAVSKSIDEGKQLREKEDKDTDEADDK